MTNDTLYNATAAAFWWITQSLRGPVAIQNIVGNSIGPYPHNINFGTPAIGFTLNRTQAEQSVNGDPILVNTFVAITACDKNDDFTDVAELSKQIKLCLHQMLNAYSGVTPYGYVSSCTWMDDLQYSSEDDEHRIWHHLGGIYRIGVTNQPN